MKYSLRKKNKFSKTNKFNHKNKKTNNKKAAQKHRNKTMKQTGGFISNLSNALDTAHSTYNTLNETYLNAKQKYQEYYKMYEDLLKNYHEIQEKYNELKEKLIEIHNNNPLIDTKVDGIDITSETNSDINAEIQKGGFMSLLNNASQHVSSASQQLSSARNKLNSYGQQTMNTANTHLSSVKQNLNAANSHLNTAKTVYYHPEVQKNLKDLSTHSLNTAKQGTLLGVNVATGNPFSSAYRGYTTYSAAKKGVSSARNLASSVNDVYKSTVNNPPAQL